METIELTGQALQPDQVVWLARETGRTVRVAIAPDALARAAAAAETAERIAARQPVYGRTTGVGANRTEHVANGDREHGLRLLRSHASGIGHLVSPAATRAMLAVRANQLLAGGAGLRPEIVEVIIAALNADVLPEIHEYGGLGTADLTALAELGLALVGERPWIAAPPTAPPALTPATTLTPPTATSPSPISPSPEHSTNNDHTLTPHHTIGPRLVAVTSGDALALISSSALTIGRACLEWRDTSRWVHAAHAVAALSHLALAGSMEPFSQEVHDRRPHRSLMASAALIRALLSDQNRSAARIQDPFALRCIPQVHGAALSSLDELEQVLAVELNVAAENPLISVDNETVYHHGGFHQSLLTQALDALKLALLAVGQLSIARLDLMFHPEFTGLRPFLADGEPASSGVMILENVAHDALAELRNAAMPAGLGHAVLSRGVEDHTPFTSHAARQAARAGDALQLVLATELVGAMRALRLRGVTPAASTPLDTLYTLAEILDPNTVDRSTTADVHAAVGLLPQFADVAAKALLPAP
ncbi:MAG TPA: aromatic amino acid ammonia-lyase [Actinocrinis sp.]|uniref:aromatic amino acid ammonia-lyase n=1 Tax=Actinocrinis sp. TaxID=1920516 RepID=UPI002DDD0CF2|nr:aromatic amino acid ammonia-lyase [Actinocrinis sp.]HEV2347783.1 aromatic amino acid ammonia-lyase [Actinocrinis sp.]